MLMELEPGLILKVNGCTRTCLLQFLKRNHFLTSCLFFLTRESLQNRLIPEKKKKCSQSSLLELIPIKKGDKNVDFRVASSESLYIHIKNLLILISISQSFKLSMPLKFLTHSGPVSFPSLRLKFFFSFITHEKHTLH